MKRRGVWVVDYRDATGRRRTPSFHTEAAAQVAFSRAVLDSRQRRDPLLSPALTVGQYGDLWLGVVARSIRPLSLVNYRQSIDQHLAPALGSLKLSDLRRSHLKRWLLALADRYAPATVGRHLRATRTMLQAAVSDELIAANPALGLGRELRLGRRDEDEAVKALDAGQLARVLAAHDAHVTLLAYTAVRVGEAVGLRWPDLDLEAGRLTVERQVRADGVVAPLKTRGSRRTLDLPVVVVETLRELRAGRVVGAAPWILYPEMGDPPTVASAKVARQWLYRRVKRAFKAAGLSQDFTPHSLRHTWASLMLQGRESLDYVKRFLGHASIKITSDLYGRWLPSENRPAVERLATRLQALEPTGPGEVLPMRPKKS